jgi:purine-binding chemotaxis protein CheW
MKRARIDWEVVRSRLQASDRMLEEALTESPERIGAAYHRRAIRLAETPTERGSASAGVPVLVFRLLRERYAIELREVSETLPLTRCTPIPGAPPQFQGVINLRGELRAVLDLGRLLGLPAADEKDLGFVLILSRPGRQIALKVDSIENVREIRQEEVSVATQGKYTKGIASGPLILLSVEAVLTEVFSKEESVTT